MSDGTIRLHLGAHKTATTYIQETLLLNRAESAAAGLAYWPLHQIRPLFRNIVRDRMAQDKSRLRQLAKITGKANQNDRARFNALFVPGMDVTLSEENVLSDIEDCYRGGLYPRANYGLSLLGDLPGDRPLEIMLSVRSYAPFLSSIYAQSLRHGGYAPWEKVARLNQTCEGQWSILVDKIRAAAPNANILIWQYENFSKVEGDVLSRLSGLPAEQIQKPVQGDVLPSASGRAISEMMAAAPDLDRTERVFKMLALTAQYPRDRYPERFAPWTRAEETRLDAAYQQDIAELRGRSDVTFLD